jgi:hypothetical protein
MCLQHLGLSLNNFFRGPEDLGRRGDALTLSNNGDVCGYRGAFITVDYRFIRQLSRVLKFMFATVVSAARW